MLLDPQLSPSHPGLPCALHPSVTANGNIGTNDPYTNFEIYGTECHVDDITGNEVGSITISPSLPQAGEENHMQTFHAISVTPIVNFTATTCLLKAATCLPVRSTE